MILNISNQNVIVSDQPRNRQNLFEAPQQVDFVKVVALCFFTNLFVGFEIFQLIPHDLKIPLVILLQVNEHRVHIRVVFILILVSFFQNSSLR